MYTKIRNPKNLAHRGASAAAPENTMAAFRLAEQMGADGIELDVHLTRDGVPVVIHDEWLDRTTSGKGLVAEHTLAGIRALDAGAWFGDAFAGEKVPTLEEVIRAFGRRMFFNIELKNSYLPMPTLEHRTIALLRHYRLERGVLVSSFNHQSMHLFRQLAPDIPTGLLFDCVLVEAPPYAKSLGAAALNPYYMCVTQERVQEAHANGLGINVWTVNDADDMKQMIELGVDAIITNHPDRLRALMNP
ncbi:MAG: glycerophosphodiester phosphodiesterase [Tumebacillaceae bacterium]